MFGQFIECRDLQDLFGVCHLARRLQYNVVGHSAGYLPEIMQTR